MKPPVSIPIVLEVAVKPDSPLQEARIKAEYAARFSSSLFTLINKACGFEVSESNDDEQFLIDIQNVCVLGAGLNNSIEELLMPVYKFIHDAEKDKSEASE